MSQVCSACNLQPAELFCGCTIPETILCRNCQIYHGRDILGIAHAFQNISMLPYYKIPGYFQRVKCRSEFFPQVKALALQSVGEVDRAIGEYKQSIELLMMRIGRHSQQVLSTLENMKRGINDEVETALAEVERTMVEDAPMLATRYGAALRYLAENCQPKPLFAFSIEVCSVPPESFVTLNYALQQPQDLVIPARFAAVHGSAVTLYDLDTDQITRQALPIDIGNSGSSIQLDENTVFCLGGQPVCFQAYLLNLATSSCSNMPHLPSPRSYAGLAKAGDYVYVFGGTDQYGNALNICERFSIGENAWRNAGKMTFCRAAFSPICYSSLIYLVSAWGSYSREVETYQPASETFRVLPVALPNALVSSCSVAFVSNGEICLLTDKGQMARWKVQEEMGFRVEITNKACFSTQTPMVREGWVLINAAGDLCKFSLQTYSFA